MTQVIRFKDREQTLSNEQGASNAGCAHKGARTTLLTTYSVLTMATKMANFAHLLRIKDVSDLDYESHGVLIQYLNDNAHNFFSPKNRRHLRSVIVVELLLFLAPWLKHCM